MHAVEPFIGQLAERRPGCLYPGTKINAQPAGYDTARPSGFGRGIRSHYKAINLHQRFSLQAKPYVTSVMDLVSAR